VRPIPDDKEFVMRTQLKLAALCVFVVVAGLAVWMGLVPDPLSRAAFTWTVAALLFFAGFAIVFIGRARAVSPIAHVLHDVEHPQHRR
jgi:hypothetical protein